MKAVGNDKQVQDYYSGGVHFFSFGPDITDEGVVQMVADAVDVSRGHWTEEEMRKGSGLESAMRKASGWFGGMRCLFIYDECGEQRNDDAGACT